MIVGEANGPILPNARAKASAAQITGLGMALGSAVMVGGLNPEAAQSFFGFWLEGDISGLPRGRQLLAFPWLLHILVQSPSIANGEVPTQ